MGQFSMENSAPPGSLLSGNQQHIGLRGIAPRSETAPADGWRTMDSAPRDGTNVLVSWVNDLGRAVTGEAHWHDDYNRGGGWWWANEGPGDYHAEMIVPEPYAWRWLPEPALRPTAAPGTEGGEHG